jgi:hypothetical protein
MRLDDRQAGAEIEITPTMIQAGTDVLHFVDADQLWLNAVDIVSAIYLAMIAAEVPPPVRPQGC